MRHIYNLTHAQLDRPSIVTIGVFDGLHRGHQSLIRRLVEEARQTNRLAVVLTFFPHPDVVLRGLTGRYYLMTPDEKAHFLMQMGVDYVVTQPFNDEVRHIRADVYVNLLLSHLQMQMLWVGSDFAMGYQREGNVPFLREQGRQRGFGLHEIDLVMTDGTTLSSTGIRQAIQSGEMEQAREWLGRAYSLSGEVVHGEGRGRKIGFPTANMHIWEEQVLPANGIYAGWARLGEERFMAMTNVGVRPTFEGSNITVEPYLLDFDRDIYGERLEVSFEKRLRPEAKFRGVDELIAQIHNDVEAGRAYLEALEASRTAG